MESCRNRGGEIRSRVEATEGRPSDGLEFPDSTDFRAAGSSVSDARVSVAAFPGASKTSPGAANASPGASKASRNCKDVNSTVFSYRILIVRRSGNGFIVADNFEMISLWRCHLNSHKCGDTQHADAARFKF